MQLTSCRTHTNISVYNALWLKVERGVFCISSKLFEVHTNARKKGNFQSCHKYLSSVTLLTKVHIFVTMSGYSYELSNKKNITV